MHRHRINLWLIALAITTLAVCSVQAQRTDGGFVRPTPNPLDATVIMPVAPPQIQNYIDYQCAGYIRSEPIAKLPELVGGEQEQEKRTYSQGDIVYLNVGANTGVTVGQEFAIIRPRGTVKSKFSRKNNLGVYVQELGMLRVVDVNSEVATAQIVKSCGNALLGDLLTPLPKRFIPDDKASNLPFDRFTDPNGKKTGRIVMARDSHEMVSVNQVVYIDLGAEDSICPGNRLTIYRPVGKGNITDFDDTEVLRGATGDYASDAFQGDRFSTGAQRSQDSGGGYYNGRTVNTPDVKKRRPQMPRKVVGEMVILNVQTRTATALILNVSQEVHTGDFVEIK